MIELSEVRMCFPASSGGALTVLDGIDLEVRAGEFLSIIGPSGCGKTTLLHLLDGLIAPTDGTVRCLAERTARVFQKPRLLPWRTALDNARFGLECRGVPGAEALARAERMLVELQLGDHLRDYPAQLSQGMRQRVNLARALLVAPDVLLLDEPFAALDLGTRRRLQDDLLALWQQRGFTVVFVSHALDEVLYLSDRVVVLSDKPTRVAQVLPVTLPRPRCVGPEATLDFLREVEALEPLVGGCSDQRLSGLPSTKPS